MDKNYNTIGIEKNLYNFKSLDEFVEIFYEQYSKFTDLFPFGEKFGYPFENYTLKNFIDLANKIEVEQNNYKDFICTMINNEEFDTIKAETKISLEIHSYLEMLSYIKFLSEEIKNYFLINYHMQVMGFEIVDIYSYVRKLIDNIDYSISCFIQKNERPHPNNILATIGQHSLKFEYDCLYNVIDLIMRDKGMKAKSGSTDIIEPISLDIEKPNLTDIANNMLKFLDISDEDLKKKDKEQRNKLLKKGRGNFYCIS